MQKSMIPEDWIAWNVLAKSSIPLIDALVAKRMTSTRNVFLAIDPLVSRNCRCKWIFCEHQADRSWNKRRKISCWQAGWSWCTIYCHGWNNWIFFPYWWFPASWSLWCWRFYWKHVSSTGMTKSLKLLKCAQKILFLYFINYSYFIFFVIETVNSRKVFQFFKIPNFKFHHMIFVFI